MPQSLLELQPLPPHSPGSTPDASQAPSSSNEVVFASYSRVGENLLLYSIPNQSSSSIEVRASVSYSGAVYALAWVSPTRLAFSGATGLGLTDFASADVDWVVENQGSVRWNSSGLSHSTAMPARLACFRDQGGQGEACVTVHDVEQPKGEDSLLFKTALEDPATSISWCAGDGNCLLVGGSKGWMRLYDLRAGSTAQATVMAHAHFTHGLGSSRVTGIRVESDFSTNLLATFTETFSEPVKIWDTRKLSSSKISHVLSISPYMHPETRQVVASTISDVAWSPVRSNLLAVAVADVSFLQTFSTCGDGTTQADVTEYYSPLSVMPLPAYCRPRRVVWQAGGRHAPSDSRLVLSTGRGYLCAQYQECAALSLSVHGELVATGMSRVILSSSARARDLRAPDRYSLEAADCVQVLTEEIPQLDLASAETALRLHRVWVWVDRCEGFGIDLACDVRRSSGSAWAQEKPFPVSFAPGLSMLSSKPREAVRRMCGWAELDFLSEDAVYLGELVEDMEIAGEFDRAAAVALWHGDLLLCINVLQRYLREESDSTGSAIEERDTQYMQMISLVAACAAGFHGQTDSTASDKHTIHNAWMSMAQSITKQLRAYAVNATNLSNKVGTFYLISLVTFLYNCASESFQQAITCVLQIEQIAVEDRVAFAWTYLSESDLVTFIASTETKLVDSGDIEGLVLTGLSDRGITLLQNYIDVHDDLQSAALLAGRMSTMEKSSLPSQWLVEYRLLLNKKELYLDRANLDVQLGRRHRQKAYESVPPTASKAPSIKREIYRPHPFCEAPHVFLRCHFCSASLPADAAQKQQQAAWQKKQGNILYSCSNCKKALPRCYVCLAHLSMVNPQIEASRYFMQKRSNESLVSLQEPAPEHSSIAIAHWCLFCQLCKHGGHAECIESWFGANKSICGVNGCSCVCRSHSSVH